MISLPIAILSILVAIGTTLLTVLLRTTRESGARDQKIATMESQISSLTATKEGLMALQIRSEPLGKLHEKLDKLSDDIREGQNDIRQELRRDIGQVQAAVSAVSASVSGVSSALTEYADRVSQLEGRVRTIEKVSGLSTPERPAVTHIGSGRRDPRRE